MCQLTDVCPLFSAHPDLLTGMLMPAAVAVCSLQVIEARKKHEASAQEERKNAIAEWLDLLASQVRLQHIVEMPAEPSAAVPSQMRLRSSTRHSVQICFCH